MRSKQISSDFLPGKSWITEDEIIKLGTAAKACKGKKKAKFKACVKKKMRSGRKKRR